MSIRQIVVLDYGIGNLLSVCRALEHIGASPVLTSDAAMVANAERLVLPGVGAFGDCVAELESRRLSEPVRAFVATERPFLGICVGMQMLLDHSDEFGGAEGLGLIPGRVIQIPTDTATGGRRKSPHIGWASIKPSPDSSATRWRGSILASTPPLTPFYFVHSFTAQPKNPSHVLAVADHDGVAVTAAIAKDNIVGTQFHPEKSGAAGLDVLAQFLAC